MSKIPQARTGHYLELEALLRYRAARRLIEAVLVGEWAPTPDALAAIAELVDQGRRFYELAETQAA